MTEARRWHNVAQAHDYTGRGIDRIREALRSGELRGYQSGKGGRWRVETADLDAWMRGEVSPVVVPVVTRRRAS